MPLDAVRDAELTDEALMGRFHNGEMPAMGELDRRYRGKMEIQAFQWLPHYLAARRELARDLVGNAILKVLATGERGRGRWDPTKGSVRVWLGGILWNEVMSFLRLKKGKETLGSDRTIVDEDGREVPFEETVPENALTAEQEFFLREDQDRLRGALDHLPPELREIVRLKFEEDCSHSEIGNRFGLSAPTVSRRLAEARGQLNRSLQHERAELPGRPRTLLL